MIVCKFVQCLFNKTGAQGRVIFDYEDNSDLHRLHHVPLQPYRLWTHGPRVWERERVVVPDHVVHWCSQGIIYVIWPEAYYVYEGDKTKGIVCLSKPALDSLWIMSFNTRFPFLIKAFHTLAWKLVMSFLENLES